MLDPYKAPAHADAAEQSRAASTWPDLVLTLLLLLLLTPLLLLNAMIALERSLNIGIDAIVGVPLTTRPAIVPAVVGLAAAARLGLSRVRALSPAYRWAFSILIALAGGTVAATQIPAVPF